MRLATLIALALSACALGAPPPLARIRRGPAWERAPARLLAMPAECREGAHRICLLGACQDTERLCQERHREAVQAVAAMSLELAGLSLIDGEQVNARLGERREVERTVAGEVHGDLSVMIDAARWSRASPGAREGVLDELEIDGLIAIAIAIGPRGVSGIPGFIEVDLRVTGRDAALAWTSRCRVAARHEATVDHAIDRAARCALDAALEVK